MEAESASSISRQVKVMAKRGLHLRLASDISRVCAAHPDVRVTISRPGKGQSADGRSPLGLVTLSAACGQQLLLTCDGAQAAQVFAALCALFANEG